MRCNRSDTHRQGTAEVKEFARRHHPSHKRIGHRPFRCYTRLDSQIGPRRGPSIAKTEFRRRRGMKRFGVWMLVVLIAIMDVGFVRPGFAQSGDSDFVPIRGASGRSVRANVFLAFWTWTAPATGPVIFDTRGTAFDTLLTIYDAETEVASNFNLDDFTLSSEVRFTAQQGRAYDIMGASKNDSLSGKTSRSSIFNCGILDRFQSSRPVLLHSNGPHTCMPAYHVEGLLV